MTTFVIDWQAWATLGTGILAVGAAVFVGIKQSRVQDRQADIQSRLAYIEERKLRSDLFDRRIAVYEASSKWFSYFATTGQVAGRPTRAQKALNMSTNKPRTPPGMDISIAFLDAMLMSRFLFRPEVERALREAWDASEQWSAADRHEGDSYRSERERQQYLASKRQEIMLVYDDLVDTFSPELHLSDLRPVSS